MAGIRTPMQPVNKWRCPHARNKAVYKQNCWLIKKKLENHYKDMQDIEFTIERGTLYMLQTRNGKRTGGRGCSHRLCDMVNEQADRPRRKR